MLYYTEGIQNLSNVADIFAYGNFRVWGYFNYSRFGHYFNYIRDFNIVAFWLFELYAMCEFSHFGFLNYLRCGQFLIFGYFEPFAIDEFFAFLYIVIVCDLVFFACWLFELFALWKCSRILPIEFIHDVDHFKLLFELFEIWNCFAFCLSNYSRCVWLIYFNYMYIRCVYFPVLAILE